MGREGEGSLSWVVTQNLPAGSVITFTGNRPDKGIVFGAGPTLSSLGDQIFAYQGEATAPAFLAGMQLRGGWNDDVIDESTSALPDALATGGAVAFESGGSHVAYAGLSEGTVPELQNALFDSENFSLSDDRETVNLETMPPVYLINGSADEYSISVFTLSKQSFGVFLTFVASGPSDIYVSTDLESWERISNANSGPTYFDSTPRGEKAFYLVQEAGVPAP